MPVNKSFHCLRPCPSRVESSGVWWDGEGGRASLRGPLARKLPSVCTQLISSAPPYPRGTGTEGFQTPDGNPLPRSPASRPHPDTLGGLTSSPGQPKECEEVGGGGEEREPPGETKGPSQSEKHKDARSLGRQRSGTRTRGGTGSLEAGP